MLASRFTLGVLATGIILGYFDHLIYTHHSHCIFVNQLSDYNWVWYTDFCGFLVMDKFIIFYIKHRLKFERIVLAILLNFPCSLFTCYCFYFQSCLALWSPRLGKRELIYMLLVHLYFYLACVVFSSYEPLGSWVSLYYGLLRRPSVVQMLSSRRPHSSNIFSSEISGPVRA